MKYLASRAMTLFLGFVAILCFSQFPVFAQVVTKQKTITKQSAPVVTIATRTSEIEIDMAARAFSNILPFDVPFILAGTKGVDDKITIDRMISVECFYKVMGPKDSIPRTDQDETPYRNFAKGYGYASWRYNGVDTKYRLAIGELDPNKKFSFFFKIRRKLSDDERDKLVHYATRVVQSLVQAKKKDGFFSPSDDEIQTMIGETIFLLSENLKESEQVLEKRPLNNESFRIASKSIEEISFAFESIGDEISSLDFKVEALKGDIGALENFLGNYKTRRGDKNKANNISVIENSIQMMKLIYNYPKDANALKADVNKFYGDQIATFTNELKKVVLPADSEFEKIRGALIDHLGGLVTDFNEYKTSLKNQEEVSKVQMNNLVAAVVNYIEDETIISGSSTEPNFVTRSNSFFTADIGVAIMPSIGKAIPYFGSNIYFRPMKQDRPLLMREFIHKDFWRRFSMVLGLTYSTLKKGGYRDDLMSTFNVITGAGLRVADFVKVNGGVIWYTKVNPNPLNTNNSIGGSGFVSLSFDFQINSIFRKLLSPDQIKIP